MSIEDRIARLERENRRLKIGALLGLLVVGAVIIMGQSRPPAELIAQRFTLVNGDGVRIGELKASDDGLPLLFLYEAGQSLPALSLGLRMSYADQQLRDPRPPRPYLSLHSVATSAPYNADVTLSLTDDIPSVTLYDRNGRGRLNLYISDSPHIQMWDEALTRVIWQAP